MTQYFKPQEALHLAMTSKIPIQYSLDKDTWVDLTKDKLAIMGVVSFMEDSPYTFRFDPNYIHVNGFTAKKPIKGARPIDGSAWIISGDNIAGLSKIAVAHPIVLEQSSLGWFETEEDLRAFVKLLEHLIDKGIFYNDSIHQSN